MQGSRLSAEGFFYAITLPQKSGLARYGAVQHGLQFQCKCVWTRTVPCRAVPVHAYQRRAGTARYGTIKLTSVNAEAGPKASHLTSCAVNINGDHVERRRDTQAN